jgi:hypothetical protein
MTDPIKTDAEQALADSKKVISDLGSAESSAVGWVKTHTAWLIGVVAFVVGAFLGYFLHR